jgi:hypothetical protein
MNKITYHKNCRHHAAVKKVKREFIKALKQAEHIEPSCNIEFTGVAEVDLFELKYMISKHYKKVHTRLTEEVKELPPNAEFSREFYHHTLYFIDDIEEIIDFIHNEYPVNVMEYTFTFSNPEASTEEKKMEYQWHFKANPLIGFKPEYFAYRGENKRQIWPFTLSLSDLEGVDKIVIKYQ